MAVRRFGVAPGAALGVAAAFGVASPLVAYSVQVYPELPAALAVTVAVAALTGPFGRRGAAVFVLAVVALPWLAVKYVPVAGVLVALALLHLWREDRRHQAGVLTGGLALAGLAFAVFHRVVYGGGAGYPPGGPLS